MLTNDSLIVPDYIFETSWEVCNKVGGIYTVLSTKANSLQKSYKDCVFFIGPDAWTKTESPWFEEDKKLYARWKNFARINQGLHIRTGRWKVPGKPIVFLIKFDQFFQQKNDIYAQMWVDFGVDSLSAYGDYDESCMFAYATGVVIESFYRYHRLETKNVVAHFNEWMLGMGALYIKKNVPKIATVFTTHATTVGRSIAGNHLPLYDNLKTYSGDQMARQLNIVAKHSIEKLAAQNVDCFTTVSDITAQECAQFFHRRPEVTPNGFEKDFIPKGEAHKEMRKKARQNLLRVAELVTGHSIHKDALFVSISGRYEYKNKGIDVFIEAMNQVRKTPQITKDVVAFIMVPAWIEGPRTDLQKEQKNGTPKKKKGKPLSGDPFTTHKLQDPSHDPVLNHLSYLGFGNSKKEHVKIIFVPSYLNGDDGIFNMDYYEMLIGMDLTVFPSYYEPWGYTPHESVAFSVPTVTTSLAGFGLWAKKIANEKGLSDGFEVISRDDANQYEVVQEIASLIYDFSLKSVEQITLLRGCALKLSGKCDWKHFIGYYKDAYSKALHNSFVRLSKPHKLNGE
ncbi:MAG: glycogen/starch synthase [Dysgonamonadaceae bacterium]|jgi:glycosyltransferase involved in cell wall biosynthesis|nr:glycogen/starch synthase [Dysgonamonadaceae bacterium]